MQERRFLAQLPSQSFWGFALNSFIFHRIQPLFCHVTLPLLKTYSCIGACKTFKSQSVFRPEISLPFPLQTSPFLRIILEVTVERQVS